MTMVKANAFPNERCLVSTTASSHAFKVSSSLILLYNIYSFSSVDSIMAELGLGGNAPAPKKAAPVRDSAPSHYSTVPNKQAIRTDDGKFIKGKK
jgi:hypothetical protein